MTTSLRFPALGLGLLIAAAASGADIPEPPNPSKGGVTTMVAQMRSGAVRIVNPDDKAATDANRKALRTVAQYLAYTIAKPPYNGEAEPRVAGKPPEPGERSMTVLMAEATDKYFTLTAPVGTNGKLIQEQLEYGAELGAEVAMAVKVVLDNSARPIERVNAVRLLSLAAKMPCPILADPLADIVKNAKESEALKYYACQGLKSLLEQADAIDPTRHIIKDAAKLTAIGQSLSAYVTAKREPRDERETAVIQYVRREAVAALARFKDGVMRKPNKEVLFRPAWQIMRVIEMDPSVTPAFTIQERIEAAAGFCLMRIDPEMNLDVAAYSVAKVLVDFAREANLDSQRAEREKTLPILPWKVAAARLSYALAVWSQAAKPLAKTRFPEAITSLADEGVRMLAPIEKGGPGAQTNSNAIATWEVNNPPRAWAEVPQKPAILFKDDPQSLLPFAVPTMLVTPPAKK